MSRRFNRRRSKRRSSVKKARQYGFVRNIFPTMFAPSETLSFEARSETIAKRTLKTLPGLRGTVDHQPQVRILGVDVDKGKITTTHGLIQPSHCTFDADTHIYVERFLDFVEEKAAQKHRKECYDMNRPAARRKVLDIAIRAMAMMWIEPKTTLLQVQLRERKREKTMIQARELLNLSFDEDDITNKMSHALSRNFKTVDAES